MRIKNRIFSRFRGILVFLVGVSIVTTGLAWLREDTSARIGELITLTELGEIIQSGDNLDEVHGVRISHEDDLSLASHLKDCPDLERLFINKATVDDLTFINDIAPENGFELWISMGYYNFEGLANPYVINIVVSSSYIQNFARGMDFPNVKSIRLENISGYEDIDYTKYPSLESLSLKCQAISDYEAFFEQLATLENLRGLYLAASNITDEDTEKLKSLQNIRSLELSETSISDLSFLAEMPNLEYLRPSLDADDLSIIKQLPNLKTFYWEGAEQLKVDEELYQYIEKHNINHFKYEPTLKETVERMASEIEVAEDATIKEKVEAVVDFMTSFIISHDKFYDGEYTSNSLLYSIHYRTAVCHDYSILEHALLKQLGVQAHYIGGLIPVHMYETDASFYTDELKYDLAGHAWLMVQDEDGVWWSWDPVQIDIGITDESGTWWDTKTGKQYNFWKRPYEDDLYSYEDFMNGIYDSYNFNFAKRRIVTNKIGYDDYLARKAMEPTEFSVSFETNGAGEIPIQNVKKGEHVTEVALPIREGYRFVGWYEDAELSQAFHYEKMILEDLTLYAKWQEEWTDPEPMNYYVMEGAGQSFYQASGGAGLVFRVNGDLDDFQGLAIDGEDVGRAFYTLAEGSTIVTMKPELLETLSEGIHTVSFNYINGGAEAVFRVAEAQIVSRAEIPDETFYACVVESYGMMNGLNMTAEDGITEVELAEIQYLACMSGGEIKDLTGIEKMDSLTGLTIIPTALTASNVDLSKNTKLKTLTFGKVAEDLEVLDLSANKDLMRVNVASSKNLKQVVLANDNEIQALNITSEEFWTEEEGTVNEGELSVALNPEAKLEKISDAEYALRLANGFAFLLNSSTTSPSGAPEENATYEVGDAQCYRMEDASVIIKAVCLENGMENVEIVHTYDIIGEKFTNRFTLGFKNPLLKATPGGTGSDEIGLAEEITTDVELPNTGSATNAGNEVVVACVLDCAIVIVIIGALVVTTYKIKEEFYGD